MLSPIDRLRCLQLFGARIIFRVACVSCVAVTLFVAPVLAQTNAEPENANAQTTNPRTTVDRTGVFLDSLALLGIEHGIRVALQPKTRDELRGNFWNDYHDSLHWPTHWEDTDPWPVNYLGHPIHGAAAGYLWLEHDPNAPRRIEFDNRYWASRGRAALRRRPGR